MNRLAVDDFDQFFEELRGAPPFPWQRRLARLVCDAESGQQWPRQIALPTASGKTACIDIALFALAYAASDDRPPVLTAPRRIFFVVDRRIIVDQAYEWAEAIRKKLLSPDTPLVKVVADRLRNLARGPHADDPAPLECFQLRGGIYRDDGWARSPLQPMVVCSTVDQLGSRLLFRGYGRSPKVWPVFAGLVGNDSLILLDEAHCSVPFAETLEAVRRYRGPDWAESPLSVPFSASVMSATLRIDDRSPFRLDADDYADERLGPRLTCDKLARLAGEIKARTATRAFAEALVGEAISLANKGAKRIAIMVNRVQTAKHAFDLLNHVPRERKELFIGRMRPLDARRIAKHWGDRLRSNVERPVPTEAVFVVATQCLEVGADFDFDALVCECASLDALRQRFGRLKRIGIGKCCATIMISADDAKGKSDDPIYGRALAATWRWLRGQLRGDSEADRSFVDMGVEAVDKMVSSLSSDELDELIPGAQHAPVMLPAHVDRWVQTSPIPKPDPAISLFLHGNERGVAEAQVCWRADLEASDIDIFAADTDTREKLFASWIASLSLCPPAVAECMPAPLWLVRRWLAGQKIEKSLLADVDGVALGSDGEVEEGHPLPALRWRGPDDEETRFVRSDNIGPGDTIVVPAKCGRWSDLGYIPGLAASDPPTDLGDEANFIARGRPVLRIYPGASRSWRVGAHLVDADALKEAVSRFELRPADELIELFSELDWQQEMKDSLAQLAGVPHLPSWLRDVASALRTDVMNRGTFHLGSSTADFDGDDAIAALVLVGRRRPAARSSSADTFTGEDETATSTTEVPLSVHLTGVARMADSFSSGCHLSPRLQRSLKVAGELHDIGKLDTRFQAWLHSGNLADALAAPEPLAKSSGRDDRKARERARKSARYPRGGRHELLSLQLVESCAQHLMNDDVDPDLVLHLIGSHHGHCRPFAPHVQDDDPPALSWSGEGISLELSQTQRKAWNPARLDSGIADRFWRLVRRYGWWGLAWLECIFVLADWRESEWEMGQHLDAVVGVTQEEVRL